MKLSLWALTLLVVGGQTTDFITATETATTTYVTSSSLATQTKHDTINDKDAEWLRDVSTEGVLVTKTVLTETKPTARVSTKFVSTESEAMTENATETVTPTSQALGETDVLEEVANHIDSDWLEERVNHAESDVENPLTEGFEVHAFDVADDSSRDDDSPGLHPGRGVVPEASSLKHFVAQGLAADVAPAPIEQSATQSHALLWLMVCLAGAGAVLFVVRRHQQDRHPYDVFAERRGLRLTNTSTPGWSVFGRSSQSSYIPVS
eukprot:Blabericola_migrator_1__13497@NODE_97_length_14383_cov_97_669181_g87_i0_p8_GENE_NODE_97_length_14383_cov_97_669181_g87_i0NODE_97_length_14383_cov_97_669181_g87_i0_p8_ORF_typecomplete_len264_score63_03TraP/PF07296_11/1_8e03TraP/PF07296_11/0_16DUF2530/PF10745_9/1_8e03DUF2530/PF10745_9/0_13_NODE_97_length_14383_cov_97_669181_g87_i020292820